MTNVPINWKETRDQIKKVKIEKDGWANYWLDQGVSLDDVKKMIPLLCRTTGKTYGTTRYVKAYHRPHMKGRHGDRFDR